jgi:serine protease Do
MTAAAILHRAATPRNHIAIAQDLERLAERLRRSTVRVHTRGNRFDGVGAGVIWTAGTQRLVVTNAHVIPASRGDEAHVEDHRGEVVAAHVVARDRERDLALLRVADADHWPEAIVLAEGPAARVGEMVVALGHPFGIAGALSLGIVHAAPDDAHRWIAADIRLAPGNSGGPLARLDGTVIGINAMIVRGLGIAVPARAVRAFIARAMAPDA